MDNFDQANIYLTSDMNKKSYKEALDRLSYRDFVELTEDKYCYLAVAEELIANSSYMELAELNKSKKA